MAPEAKTGGVVKMMNIIDGMAPHPKHTAAAAGLMGNLRSFIEKDLPMSEDVVLID